MTPPRLAPRLHCLPPILHRLVQTSMPSYSKAPRGLFVLLRVGRIFTANSISPSLSLRQRSSRYTIRAGQNLPDKEFRSRLLRLSQTECLARGLVISANLYMSPCSPDFILTDLGSSGSQCGVSRLRLAGSSEPLSSSSVAQFEIFQSRCAFSRRVDAFGKTER